MCVLLWLQLASPDATAARMWSDVARFCYFMFDVGMQNLDILHEERERAAMAEEVGLPGTASAASRLAQGLPPPRGAPAGARRLRRSLELLDDGGPRRRGSCTPPTKVRMGP